MAKAHGLNIYGYLKFLLEHRPTKEMTDDQLAELAPWSEKLQSIKNRMWIIVNYSNSQRAGVNLYLTASLFGGYRKIAHIVKAAGIFGAYLDSVAFPIIPDSSMFLFEVKHIAKLGTIASLTSNVRTGMPVCSEKSLRDIPVLSFHSFIVIDASTIEASHCAILLLM